MHFRPPAAALSVRRALSSSSTSSNNSFLFHPPPNPPDLQSNLGFETPPNPRNLQPNLGFQTPPNPRDLQQNLGFQTPPNPRDLQPDLGFQTPPNPRDLQPNLGFRTPPNPPDLQANLGSPNPPDLQPDLGFETPLNLPDLQPDLGFDPPPNLRDLQPDLGFDPPPNLWDLQPDLGFTPPPNPRLPPIVPSKDADALSHLLIQHHNPFHPSESSTQLAGVSLSPSLVLQTLLRLRNFSKIALGFFVWAREHAHCSHTADANDLMVDILGKVRQFDAAWTLVMEMEQGGAAPSPRTFAVLVRRYVAAGLTRQAVRAFDDMEAFIGREPGIAEFNMLLDTLCKYGYPKVATEIFNKRKNLFEPDEKSYTILIYGWCKVNKEDMAHKFLKEMIERGVEANVVTYNVLLNGICRRASLHPDVRFDRTVRAAENLLTEMRGRGIEPDVTSYSIIIHVYSRAHKPDLSVHMMRLMKEKGISPTVVTYTSVIKCLASCGRLEEAEELLNDMMAHGVCPSPATYNCFFKEYRGRKDTKSAMKLYNKVKDIGSSGALDMHSYNILVGMFSRLSKMEIVMDLWNDMIEKGVGPDMDSYTLLIHGLCERQKWQEACQFFMEMIEKGFLPQKVTFETLYTGLIQADLLKTWRRLKKKVDEESVKFSSEFQQYRLKPYKR